jgi:nucleotide-binding universal stress UspA family protein
MRIKEETPLFAATSGDAAPEMGSRLHRFPRSTRHAGNRMGGTILCDVTDARDGRCARGFAGALATRLGLRLVLVLVVRGTPARKTAIGKRRLSEAERALAAAADELGDVETRLAFGNHSTALARVAAEEGADMVIVGSHATGFGGRNLRCGIVRQLEAETPVPVLVAPPSTRKRTERRLALAADAGSR